MMKHLQSLIFFFIFLMICYSLNGQNLETSHLIWNRAVFNNAALTHNHYANITADFRQTQSGGIDFNSAMVWMDYPILYDNKNTGAFFIMLENEKSGSANDFNTLRANAALSKKIRIHANSHVQFGLGVGYVQYKLSLGGLSTSSQYIQNFGFSNSLPNGESGLYQTSYFTINTGLAYQAMDYDQSQILTIGISANNLNKQIQEWESIISKLPMQWSAQSQYLTYINPFWAMGSDLTFFNEGSNFNGIGGLTFRYFVDNQSGSIENEDGKHLNTFVRVASQKKGIVGFQYKSENYALGFSYDFPFGKLTETYGNTFEVLIAYRPKIEGRKKKIKNINEKESPISSVTKTEKENKPFTNKNIEKDKVDDAKKSEIVSKDSIPSEDENKGTAKAGAIKSGEFEDYLQVSEIYFVFGSSELEESSKQHLKDLYERYIQDNRFDIHVTGHTDNVGSEEINKQLSLLRAREVAAYLKSLGISEEHIKFDGKGERDPIAPNDTSEGRAKNRRVEIELIPR